jgi:hypothetical protein
MKRNMGTLDRVLRTFVAAPILVVVGVVLLPLGSVFSIIALALAGVMLATSAAGFCPLYSPFGFSTRRDHPGSLGGRLVAPQH